MQLYTQIGIHKCRYAHIQIYSVIGIHIRGYAHIQVYIHTGIHTVVLLDQDANVSNHSVGARKNKRDFPPQ